ncbi:hypothetical protein A2Z56_02410 [Candidatus Kaiserbacteria bacterium RIFCSPHIGHO2_12_45_16]|nr:MAG: hypothetical protein A2Z56_02410 [Candidatus Kaiserbacteria bacterium RIFCSPHIGHO2_12_45_16]
MINSAKLQAATIFSVGAIALTLGYGFMNVESQSVPTFTKDGTELIITKDTSLNVEEFTQGGGILRFEATTTQAARTLTAAEMAAYNVIDIVSTSSPALTLTLPATSTWTAIIPAAGDFREWIIDNQHAAATTTTVVAGTGIDLIAVTANDDVIDGVEKSRLSCWRKYDTNIACSVSELAAAD